MVIIGVDPGTALTGYGFIDLSDRGELSVIDYGVICTPAKDKMENRLLQLYSEINEKYFSMDPKGCRREVVSQQCYYRNQCRTSQRRYPLSLARAGIDVDEFTPMEVKQAVVGYGAQRNVKSK